MTTFLNLDEIGNQVEYSFKLNGTTHIIKPATVDSFVENVRAVEKLGVKASMAEESEVVIAMLLRLAPSLTRKDLGALTLEQLRALSDFARKANGEIVEVADGAAEEGNGKKS